MLHVDAGSPLMVVVVVLHKYFTVARCVDALLVFMYKCGGFLTFIYFLFYWPSICVCALATLCYTKMFKFFIIIHDDYTILL